MRSSKPAFSIVEILVAVVILGLLGTGAAAGLLAINRIAVGHRLATCAQAVAQSALERVLAEPFPDPLLPPASLVPGTELQAGVPLYTDPATGQIVATASVETVITDISREVIPARPVPPLRHARVSVTYVHAGRPQSLTLESVRTAD